jgi:hypothetical protein
MKTIFLLLLCCVSIMAQTQADLRKKYGAPVSEIYEVRPNVSLTVTYGKEGQTCAMHFEPKFTDSKLPEVTSATLANVFDEIVPADKRGKNIINGFFSGIGFYGTWEDYEKLQVYKIDNPDGKKSVGVLWKDESCNNSLMFKSWSKHKSSTPTQ